MDVDLEGFCEIPSNQIKDFNTNLLKMVPELKNHRCGIDEPGGFVKRLKEGTYLAHICEHIIIALQNRFGIDAAYGKSREISGDLYYIVYQYEYKQTAVKIGEIACEIINSLIYKNNFSIKSNLKIVNEILENEKLGPSTYAIYKEAQKSDIPVIHLNDGSMLQLGYGKYSKILEATIGPNTSAAAVDISCDKLLTKKLLTNQCIPVARGGIVKNTIDLLIKAEKLEYPVVLKPRYGNQGKGVFVNIKDEKEALQVYNFLKMKYKDIIIEKHIFGKDYRVCVVGNKISAVAERIPPFITGDGKRSIRVLINNLNSDEKRGNGHEKPLTKVKIDEELKSYIGKSGYDLNSILEKDRKLVLRENANISTGGVSIDRTDEICEENKNICLRTAKTIGLDICGIDICTEDISVPIERYGAVIEVNAAPGIRMHEFPTVGESRNVAGDIVNMLFNNNYKAIPIISVTGTNGKTTTTRLIGHVMGLAGYNVGMTTTGGIYINNKCIEKGDTTGPESALTILTSKEIDAAVLETARGGLVRKGLAYELADVGVITNITNDHLGIDGIDNMEQLAFTKSLVVEAVKKNGYAVINADDEMSLSILNRIKCNIVFFSKDKNNEYIHENTEKGGISIYIDGENLVVQEAGNKETIMKVSEIGITMKNALEFNVENAMAACAALKAINIDNSIIRKGFSSFYCNEIQNPGRFNMFTFEGKTVILDYGHNIAGYRSILESIKKMNYKRLIGIIGVPGDRMNKDILEAGNISGKYFDYIYIKEDQDKRGRKNGEVADILKQGVKSSDFNMNNLQLILDESYALTSAIEKSLPGDLIVIFFENYEPLLDIIKEHIKDESSSKEYDRSITANE